MNANEKQIRETLGIPPQADLLVLDLGEGIKEVRTAGWTDEQIKEKSLGELDAMIGQSEKATESLRLAIRKEEQRADQVRAIRVRKIQIGGV